MALSDTISICAAATALPAAPTSWAYVSEWAGARRPADAVFQAWSDATSSLTGLELGGGVAKPFSTVAALGAKTFVVLDQPTGKLTITAHSYVNGDGPFLLTTTGTLPAGLDTVTPYYVGVVDANTVQLYTSLDGVLSKGMPVAVTSAGSGTNSIAASTLATARLRWPRVALLGSAGDGAVSLAPTRGYEYRFRHVPQALAYALIGTPTGSISAAIYLENPVL